MKSARSVLVVDDDEDVRRSVADALEDEGYRVATAPNGGDALRLLKDESVRPDLILLDMMMPGMDGWAFREEQRRDPEIASIPIVVFTAHGVPRETAQQLDAAGYVMKPPRLRDLLSALERVHRGQRDG
jgi:CheY-like chemotaxis protein